MCTAFVPSPMLRLAMPVDISSTSEVSSPTVDLGRDFEVLIRRCLSSGYHEQKVEKPSGEGASGHQISATPTHDNTGTMKQDGGETELDSSDTNVSVSEKDTDPALPKGPKILINGQDETYNHEDEDDCKTEEESKKTVSMDVNKKVDASLNNKSADVEKPQPSTSTEDDNTPAVPLRHTDNKSPAEPCDTINLGDFENDFPVLIRNKSEKTRIPQNPRERLKFKKISKKKWKKTAPEDIGFDVSLLPNRDHQPSLDVYVLREMETELTKFEAILAEVQNKTETADAETISIPKDSIKSENAEATITSEPKDSDNIESVNEVVMDETCLMWNISYLEDELIYHHQDIEDTFDDDAVAHLFHAQIEDCDMLDKLSDKLLQKLDLYTGTHCEKRIRFYKHKWKVEKARKQAKTKQCRTLDNRARGTKILISHKIMKQINLIYSRRYTPALSLKKIDKRADELNQQMGGYKWGCMPNESKARVPIYRPPPVRKNQPPPRYAANANNVDRELDQNIINILINIQDRDITPEDYDLLLRLDERVAPKTVDENLLKSFKTEPVCEKHVGQACAVCMETYTLGQMRKYLPCDHVFHSDCIDMWLENSSPNCPLDGLPLE